MAGQVTDHPTYRHALRMRLAQLALKAAGAELDLLSAAQPPHPADQEETTKGATRPQDSTRPLS